MEGSRGQRFEGADGVAVAAPPAAASEVHEVSRQVLIHLRDQFGGLLSEHDFEDLAQEALAEIHRRRRQGQEVREPVAFAKKVAWRRARDLIRDNHSVPKDPRDELFELRADESVDFDRALAARAQLARAIEAAERLPEDEQAVYRSHFFEQRKPRETCAALGLRRREYYLRLERATLAVQAALAPHSYETHQRELLSAVIGGSASAAETRRAKRLVRHDPAAAALVRELRELHQGAAALLPAPALDELADLSVFERLGQGAAWIRDRATGGPDPSAEQLAAQLGASGAGRAGAVGAGGVLAHLGLAGGAGKVALACLGTGALTTACVLSGLVPGVDLDRKEPVSAGEPTRATAPPNPDLVRRLEPGRSDPARATSTQTGGGDAPDASPDSVSPAVSPSAPPAEQEFGVASAAPAPSPADAPGGTASSEDVQQEFGP